MAKKGVLENLVVGWDGIEPIVMGCISANLNMILRGRHGASKTVFAKLVAQAIGGRYRHYDATKDDLVSVAGIPNPEALAKGRLQYARHGRTAWGADYISIDELTRAPKESQNMWLELLEEKTLFGRKLRYKMAIATMNPTTYSATYRLDEALLDRFVAVVDIPDVLAKVREDDIETIVELNMNGNRGTRAAADLKTLGDAVLEINQNYHAFMASDEVRAAVRQYCAKFAVDLRNNVKADEKYVSPRRFIHLANCIVATAAYFKFAQSRGYKVTKDSLFVEAALQASTYVIGTSLNLPSKIIEGCHLKASPSLKGVAGDVSDKLRQVIREAKTMDKQIDIFLQEMGTIEKWSPAEVGGLFSGIVSDGADAVMKQVETLAENIKNSTDMSATALKNLLRDCGSVDRMFKVCDDMTAKSAVSMRVSSDQGRGMLRVLVVGVMNTLARAVAGSSEFKNSKAYTFNSAFQAGDRVEDLQEIWNGTLVDGSLEKTIRMLLENKPGRK